MTELATNDVTFQQLFTVYSMFAERNEKEHLQPEQAEFLIDEILRELRRSTSPKNVDLPEKVTFSEFHSIIHSILPNRDEMKSAVHRLFDRFINHLIGQGFIMYRECNGKRRCRWLQRKSKRWQTGWLVISPGRIRVLTMKGAECLTISVDNDANASIECCSHESSENIPKTVWTIISNGSAYQFAHLDSIQAYKFVKEMRQAADYCTRDALLEHDQQRSLRCTRGRRQREQLESEKRKLVNELEEERRTLHDEQIVRGLTARLLKQEMEKSEQMQHVIYELRAKLHEDEEEEHPDGVELCPYEENEHAEITWPSRERQDQLEQYAYHLYASQAEHPITSDDEEVWKHNYNLIVSTQSI